MDWITTEGTYYDVRVILVTSLITTVTVYILLHLVSFITSNHPPCHGFWIPYIGCAIQFGKEPLLFIDKMTKQLGPIFTLKVAGKRLTFLTDPEDFSVFFQSECVDFQKAVQIPVQKTASVSAESFFENHTKIHDIVKGRLAPSLLDPFCDSLGQKFVVQLGEWGPSGKTDLNNLIRSTMYVPILCNLFGDFMSEVDHEELQKQFVRYDEDFEYGSQLPEYFLKKWKYSKHWLLTLFKREVGNIRDNGYSNSETVFESLMRAVDPPHAANYGLLMMWASLANAIPITFWTLAFILSHKEITTRLTKDVSRVVSDKKKGSTDAWLSIEDLQKLPFLKQCVLETIRLRSPGVITREVTKPISMKNFVIPEGDMLMISPYWAHRNSKYFPDPDSFKPERWDTIQLDKNKFLDGFIAFGGGRYQCPGRWFGLLEIQLLIAMILHQFDIHLLEEIPDISALHLVGTQQPAKVLNVEYRRKPFM